MVRSLRSDFAELKELVYENDYDVVAVAETWLSGANTLDMVNLDNYVFYRRDWGFRSRGVGVYVKAWFGSEQLNLRYYLDENCAFDSVWLKLFIHKTSFVMETLYRSPDRDVNSCIDDLDYAV